MSSEIDDKVQFKLQRSDTTLIEAKNLAGIESWNGVINRLYYAAFYAVSALLLNQGFQVKTHAGQKSKLNELFLANELITRESGNAYNVLFNFRNDGDYEDFAIYAKEDAEPLIARTENLIDEIKKLIY